MTTEIITAIADLLKHCTSKYIETTDTKLNLLLYAFVSILISYILKLIFNFEMFKEQCNYIKWYITYKMLKREKIIYPVSKDYEFYTPEIFDKDKDKFEKCNLKHYELVEKNKFYFLEAFGIRLNKNRSYNKNREHACTYMYNFKDINNSVTANLITKVNITYATFNNYFKSKAKDLKVIAYINGYDIYIDISAFNNREDESLRIMSNNKEALDLFFLIVQKDIDDNKHLILPSNNNLEVVEYDKRNGITKVGNVKPSLTFDNYISRHKPMILKTLDSFQNGKLYNNNPYIENNIGFMLYGEPGTGKTCFVTVIANYLKRNIFNINFTKVKTKSEFRDIMKPENISKYVYCFDEFDYLLSTLLVNPDKSEQNADIRVRIQALSTQINACTDPDGKNILIEQMKSLMENGNNDDLTYEFLLGELSGLTSVNGRVIIATSNFIDKIPKAMLRPGRLDIILHLGHFNDAEIKELIIKLYKPNADDLRLIKKTTFPCDKYTPSQLIMKASIYKSVPDIIMNLTKNNQNKNNEENSSDFEDF